MSCLFIFIMYYFQVQTLSILLFPLNFRVTVKASVLEVIGNRLVPNQDIHFAIIIWYVAKTITTL